MNVKQHQRFTLSDASFLSAVKRDIAKLAAKGAFSETETGRINIVVSEMASNLVRHATEGGELLVKLMDEPDPIGIEIISLDKGPGMAEPQRMLEDGVSTFGSAGEGLGAIKRQSDLFDFYSQPQGGTVMLSRIYKTVSVLPEKPKKRKPEVGAVMVSKRNGEVCGDGWSLQESGGATYILAMDGLGHGLAAHEASKLAVSTFSRSNKEQVTDRLLEIHAAIKPTRGGVGAVARIGTGKPAFSYFGIGNISARIFGLNDGGSLEVTKNLISFNGTLGHIIPAIFQEQPADWQAGNLLVMHSDGLRTLKDLKRYPKLNLHHASLIAAVLFRDFNRGTDDALVIVAKAKT